MSFAANADQARARIYEALTKARELSHPGTIAYVRGYRFTIHELCGDVQAALVEAEAYLALSKEQGFSLCIGEAMAFSGWALAETSRPAEGIRKLRKGIAGMLATRMKMFMPYQRAHLADAYGRLEFGRRPSGCISSTGRLRNRSGPASFGSKRSCTTAAARSWPPAPIRTRSPRKRTSGMPSRSPTPRVPGCGSCGRRRASPDWRDQGRRAEAYDLLAPVCGWFTEGFDTPDLRDAKALLDDLASAAPGLLGAPQRFAGS